MNNLGVQLYVPGHFKHSVGFGARPFARWYILHKNTWGLFFEYGVSHVHVSNGYIFGPDRNPAYNSDGAFIAFRFDAVYAPLDKLFNDSKIAYHRKSKKIKDS